MWYKLETNWQCCPDSRASSINAMPFISHCIVLCDVAMSNIFCRCVSWLLEVSLSVPSNLLFIRKSPTLKLFAKNLTLNDDLKIKLEVRNYLWACLWNLLWNYYRVPENFQLWGLQSLISCRSFWIRTIFPKQACQRKKEKKKKAQTYLSTILICSW